MKVRPISVAKNPIKSTRVGKKNKLERKEIEEAGRSIKMQLQALLLLSSACSWLKAFPSSVRVQNKLFLQ